MEATISNHNF